LFTKAKDFLIICLLKVQVYRGVRCVKCYGRNRDLVRGDDLLAECTMCGYVSS
jgi:hypothetical protein